ncbi:cilia- and flagella-associated protein 43 [Dendroctonus ponderosae]|uniref:cilia- and flagella-associated protein 43 n=1 Tax=Dendroctonus ponderosae TaxID=77166 RepID=UPI0020360035|nr:cilia- and flagella-associated protein 43 [Dendroctonus ponderosae]
MTRKLIPPAHVMRATDNQALWTKIGIIKELSLMAKSVIIYGRGCFLKFLNVNTGEEMCLTLNDHNGNGDGLKCYRGHSSLYIFAYSECCQRPFIYVKSYPDFQLIVKFEGEREGFKCLAFSDSSLLFSLGEMPHYKVTAWNWRSMDKFAESANELLFENQIIRCSYGRPMYLAQLGVGSTKLFIWDVFTVCKSTIFDKHQVKIGNLKPAPFESVVWSVDGVALYIIDRNGSIYTFDRDFYLELVVDVSNAHICGTITPSICWYQHGLTVSGPNKEIRHYKKVGSAWICDSSFPTEQSIGNIMSGKYEKCIGHTDVSEIVSFGTSLESVAFLKKGESSFSNICILNPLGEFVIVVRASTILDAYRMDTGKRISSITLEHNISSIADNPAFPFVAVGQETGNLKLVSFHNEAKPNVLINLPLAGFSLGTTRFFEQGNIFVTGNKREGDFFILKGLPGTQIEVIKHLHVGQQVVDYMLVASQNMIRFFAIPVTQDQFYAGNRLLRYCIVDKQVVNIKEFNFSRDDCWYRKIYAKKGPDRDRMFYLIPFNCRHVEEAETKRGNPSVFITRSIKSGHQMKYFVLSFGTKHAITWGVDGFVFVRSPDFQDIVGMSLSHHRFHKGVAKAITNPAASIIVSLGCGGLLAAVKCVGNEEDETLMGKLREEKLSTKLALMFKRPTLGFEIEERFIGKCWLEIQKLKKIEAEEAHCKKERNKILSDFQYIQSVVQNLVTENLRAPENKTLDLLEFYLDAQAYHRKQQRNKKDCKELETYLKSLIIAQDKVSEYIIKNYYIPMGVQWHNIVGIFSAVKATNYCLLPENLARSQRLNWIEEQRKVEQYLSSQDTFEPWQTLTKEELQEILAKRPAPPKNDYTGLTTALNLQEEIDVVDPEKFMETKIAITGSVAQLYIDISPGHYRQRQLNTFYQCELQQAVAEREVIRLKQCYNKCFQNTRAIKEREMYNIKEKNARLRQIISEFNYFSDTKLNIEINDPEWEPIENVETDILRVADEEVPVGPYVSPSEQALLDAKAAEEERLRLLLLADDFRERALMAMMNGVLEIRWEDELKKDVPKPKCLLEKSPEEFIEDDLRAIREYEDKVVQLKTEREKYKSLLEVEFGKLSLNLRDSIRKFNQKLYDCTKFKFYIDSGMNQENLMVNRQRVIQNGRIELDATERNIMKQIRDYELAVEENQRLITRIQEALGECRNNMETMQSKEKQLEKAYRRDFQDMSPVIQEQAYKLYKKRPKVNFRTISTATVLNELAKCVISNEITYALTQECLDYINALETLDLFAGLPPTIDETVWHLICKHRRFRIEYDMRLRAAQIQILEGEATIATFQKRVATQKEKTAILNTELDQTRADRLYLIHNKQMQLVLRRGLVEIPLTGDLFTDFSDAILVPKAEIEYVNNLIVEAGKLKLKTIEKNLKFRRTMMAIEWEHTKLRMKINDFIEQKRDIENVKFTKEMQSYLKNKSLGRKQDIESYEMEVELLAAAYENRIKDKKDKVKKISVQLKTYRESNKHLDQLIKEINIDLCHYQVEKDYEVEKKEKEILKARMSAMLNRNQLVLKVQKNHNEILVLQAELELLRLRTFPTLKYKVLDE